MPQSSQVPEILLEKDVQGLLLEKAKSRDFYSDRAVMTNISCCPLPPSQSPNHHLFPATSLVRINWKKKRNQHFMLFVLSALLRTIIYYKVECTMHACLICILHYFNYPSMQWDWKTCSITFGRLALVYFCNYTQPFLTKHFFIIRR